MERGCSFQLNMVRMKMKMAAVSTITVLLLCCTALASKGSQDGCDYRAEINNNFTLPLQIKVPQTGQLRWIYNNKLIFHRKQDQVLKGKKDDVSENGSLKMTNLKKQQEGTYKAEVYNEQGQLEGNMKPMRLCILDPLQQPTVTIECIGASVNFTCTINKTTTDITFAWHQNNKELKTGKKSLTAIAEDVKKDSFACIVSNGFRSLSSGDVQQSCFKEQPSQFPDTLFGINIWIFVGGGGGVVLILIVIVIICCVRNRRKNRMQLKDEEELRLGFTNSNQQQHHHHEHNHPPNQHPNQHHHHHHHQQQPAGHTGPRQHRAKQQRNQQRPPRAPDHSNGHPQPSPRRPPQAPKSVDDDEQPPPLPQPRKKAPKTPRV